MARFPLSYTHTLSFLQIVLKGWSQPHKPRASASFRVCMASLWEVHFRSPACSAKPGTQWCTCTRQTPLRLWLTVPFQLCCSFSKSHLGTASYVKYVPLGSAQGCDMSECHPRLPIFTLNLSLIFYCMTDGGLHRYDIDFPLFIGSSPSWHFIFF